MLINLMLGLGTMVVCLLLQVTPLLLTLRYYMPRRAALAGDSWLQTVGVIATGLMILVIGNLFQIAVWALLFAVLGEFEVFADAFYFSAVNFSTLGYGDIVMSQAHRLLGPLEAINGVLMIGISSATILAIIQDTMRQRRSGSGED